MFRVIRLKMVLLILAIVMIVVSLGVGIVVVAGMDSVPKYEYVIVIDAGHGGRDDGCEGVTGTKESEINLAIAKELKDQLETLGIRVILTRADGNGLYDANATNYKASDMAKRVEIINNVNADMVISIHCNSYADSSQCGAQAFYQEGDEVSENFAKALQSQLINQLPNARKEANFGDYYLLKESPVSAVLIECGYLSNANEEGKLNDEKYQSQVAYAIMCGVVKYFDLCGND